MRAVTDQSPSDATRDPSKPASRAGPGDMPPEEFRRWAHEVADWMASYLRDVGNYPVLPGVEPGALPVPVSLLVGMSSAIAWQL